MAYMWSNNRNAAVVGCGSLASVDAPLWSLACGTLMHSFRNRMMVMRMVVCIVFVRCATGLIGFFLTASRAFRRTGAR